MQRKSIPPDKKQKSERYNRAALRYTGYNEKEDADGTAPSKTKTNPKQCFTRKIAFGSAQYGGPGGIRTLDLSDANRTLSQLSYRPMSFRLDKCTSFLLKSQGGNADFVLQTPDISCNIRIYIVTDVISPASCASLYIVL